MFNKTPIGLPSISKFGTKKQTLYPVGSIIPVTHNKPIKKENVEEVKKVDVAAMVSETTAPDPVIKLTTKTNKIAAKTNGKKVPVKKTVTKAKPVIKETTKAKKVATKKVVKKATAKKSTSKKK